ncbi:MAG: branched-chain amino acid transport system II carrier protein [Eubacteriales bacterium]|nr:branched-chain amino acid transport system II carrier protein [Eubacteriales bacterium]
MKDAVPKKIKAADVLFIGLAFFATYFGAGNLIFPPMLGLQSGTKWFSGMIGMLASGVGLPVLALLILGYAGSVQNITNHVNKKFYTLFIGLMMILCCCVSIPRTAAVGIEMGLQGVWSKAPYKLFVVIYFVIAFLFAKDRGSALDKVGKILTPVMTVILVVLVIKGIADPLGKPAEPSVESPALSSFLGGYSTGDALVSFLMTAVFFSSIRQKGYRGKQFQKVNVGAGLITAACLAVIYGGLYFMGASVSGTAKADIGNAALLLLVIRKSGGQIAIYGLCISVVLACLTTAIGQITAVADFFDQETNRRLPYKYVVLVVPIVTIFVASFGLDSIVTYTAPWFGFAYPIAMVLMLLGIFGKFVPNDGGYKGAVYVTVVYSFFYLLSSYGLKLGIIDKVLNEIPLYSLGFGWVVPAAVGFVLGLLIYPHTKSGKAGTSIEA